MIRRAMLLAWLLAGLPAAPAMAAMAAAPVGAGVSTWTVQGGGVTLRYTFPEALAARLVPPRAALPPVKKISGYVLAHATVEQQGVTCPAVDQGYDLGTVDARYAGPGLSSFEILFRCPRATGALLLRNAAFFELAPGQIGIARLYVDGGAPVIRVLTARDTAIRVSAGAPAPSPPAAYGWLGIRHALGTLLCLGAALGLALLAPDRRTLALVAGALGSGYVLASLAAGAGGLLLEPRAAQACAGVLVALFAAQLTARNSSRPRLAAAGLAVVAAIAACIAWVSGWRDAALALAGAGIAAVGAVSAVGLQRRAAAGLAILLIQALLVGLIDGFALALRFAPLREFYTPATGQLLAYDAGALLGMLLVAGLVSVILAPLRRLAPARAPLGRDLLAAALAGVGAWSMLAL